MYKTRIMLRGSRGYILRRTQRDCWTLVILGDRAFYSPLMIGLIFKGWWLMENN